MVNQGDYSLRHDVDRLQNKVNVFENEFSDSYFIECSVPAVFYKSDTFYPSSITFYSYQDSKGKTSTYKGTLKVYTSVDGSTYKQIKTSTDSNITIQVTDTDIKFYKCELYNADNELYDSQTIPLLKDGVEGKDGSSPISIFLGNEAQLIPCTSEGVVQETISFTIPFYCYKGTAMYTCNYAVGSTNYWTQQGFTYQLDKQCSTTDNGQLTITAPKDSSLRGLKHSNITMDFVVDGETISKEFNWAKVIKGEDGVDGVDGTNGTDGETPNCYVKYSKTATPESMSELSDVEIEGWEYQGIAWTTATTAPTTIADYKPFVKYCATDGTKGEDGYVHIAYSSSSDGKENFTTGTPTSLHTYMGTCTDNNSKDPTEARAYKWVKIKGEDGADGETPSNDTIKEVVKNTEVNAVTLNGNTEDSFIRANIPVETICRDDSKPDENYVKIYQLGQIVIMQLYRFSGDSSTYGLDSENTSYFYLMENINAKRIPSKLCPSNVIFVNDLNSDTDGSNGRIRITPDGKITKLVQSKTAYNNTYATIIYPILPKTDTQISLGSTSNKLYYGDTILVYVYDKNDNTVSGVPVLVKLASTTTSDTFEYVANTNSSGYVEVSITPTPNLKYDFAVQCKGNGNYNVSDTVTFSKEVSATTVQLTAEVKDNTINGTVKNQNGKPLSNVKVYLGYSTSTTTNSNGEYSFTVLTDGTYNINVLEAVNMGISADASTSVTIGSAKTTTQYSKVPTGVGTIGTVTSTSKENYWTATDVSRVQTQENNMDLANCAYGVTNGSGYSYHSKQLPIYFNGFGFENKGTLKNVHVKIMCGAFPYSGTKTGGSMQIPDAYLMIGDTSLGGVKTTDTFPNVNIYYPIEFDVTNISVAQLINSDLRVKLTPKQNQYITTGSYNKATFRIDYIVVTATFEN